jgi:hypothetical protein
MDMLSIVIIAGIVLICLLSTIFGLTRSLDKRARDMQGKDPDTARALREARRNIDRGQGFDPRL